MYSGKNLYFGTDIVSQQTFKINDTGGITINNKIIDNVNNKHNQKHAKYKTDKRFQIGR